MKSIVKYNQILLSIYALVMVIFLLIKWDSFAISQLFVIGFLGLITLHIWEETKFPGGFLQMMGGIMNVDMTVVQESALHLPATILIVVLTGLPLIFPELRFLLLAVFYLGIFEGIIHIAGIKLGQRTKPYTPGMITGEILLIYSVTGIITSGNFSVFDFLYAFIYFLISFILMELGTYTVLGMKISEVIAKIKGGK